MARLLIPNLVPGREYAIQIRPENSGLTGNWSQVITFTAPQAREIPQESQYDVSVKGSIYVKADDTSPAGYRDDNTGFYVDSDGYMSIKNIMYFDPTTIDLTITGNINAFSGNFINTLNVGAGSATVNTSASVYASVTTIPMVSTSGISIGSVVSGTGIPASTTVVGKDASSIFINKLTTSSIAATTSLSFAAASGLLAVGTNSNSKINILGTSAASTTKIYSTVGGVDTTASSGSGFYVDASGSLNIGNKLKWNGTNLTIDGSGSFSGSLSASTGLIGGWVIAGSSIYSGSAAGNYTGMTSSANAGAKTFFSGASDNVGTSASFYVTNTGSMVAQNASISGSIVANSGSITGDLNISSAGRLIAGTGSYVVTVAGTGITGTQGGIPVFTLPSSADSAPTIGGFKVVQTGLVSSGQTTIYPVSFASGSTITMAASSASTLWVGMSASVTNTASTAVITGISGGSVTLSVAPSATFSNASATFIPNANLIVGTSASNNITIRGQNTGTVAPSIFTVINNTETTATSGNGFYLGQDGRFRLAGSNGYVSIDGSGNFFVSGSISAASGLIGGWTISSSALTTGTNASAVGLISTASNGGVAIYAGSSVPLNAPFYVTNTGSMVATTASITGSVTFNAGYIGGTSGWTIQSASLTGGSSGSTVGLLVPSINGGISIFAGNATPSSAPFYVTNTGSMVSTSGSIGGWLIGSAALSSTSSNIILNNTGSINVGTSTSKINILGGAVGSGTKIYTTISGTDTTETTGAGFYFDASGSLNIGSKLKWDGSTLQLSGTGTTYALALSAGTTDSTNYIAIYDTSIGYSNTYKDAYNYYDSAPAWSDYQTPFYVDATGKFSLGESLTWNPSSSLLTVQGTVTTSSGTIGGFNITSNSIEGNANSGSSYFRTGPAAGARIELYNDPSYDHLGGGIDFIDYSTTVSSLHYAGGTLGTGASLSLNFGGTVGGYSGKLLFSQPGVYLGAPPYTVQLSTDDSATSGILNLYGASVLVKANTSSIYLDNTSFSVNTNSIVQFDDSSWTPLSFLSLSGSVSPVVGLPASVTYSLTGGWKRLGKTVIARILITIDSGTPVGTTVIAVSRSALGIPIWPADYYNYTLTMGNGFYRTVGGGFYATTPLGNTSTSFKFLISSNGGAGNSVFWTGNTLSGQAAGDRHSFTLMYEST